MNSICRKEGASMNNPFETNSSFCRVRPLSIAHSYKCFERFKRFRTQFDG